MTYYKLHLIAQEMRDGIKDPVKTYAGPLRYDGSMLAPY